MMADQKIVKELQNEYFNNFGLYPEIVLKAPGRINLIGEHTDYNGGLVLPAAIDKCIYFAAGNNNSNDVAVYSFNDEDTEKIAAFVTLKNDVSKEPEIIKKFLRNLIIKKMGKHKTPNRIIILPKLPYTESGKI